MKTLIFIILSLFSISSFSQNYNGIDVSHHNGKINWNKIDNSKIKFVYIKASEGKSFKDPRYHYNILGAKAKGILVGSYHFYSIGVSPEEQYAHFKNTMSNYPQDLVPVIDVEDWKKCNKFKLLYDLVKLNSLFYKDYGIYPIIYSTETYYRLRGLFLLPNLTWLCASNNCDIIQFSPKSVNGYILDINYCPDLNKIKFN